MLGAGDRSRSTTDLISAPEGIYILVGMETRGLPGTRHTRAHRWADLPALGAAGGRNSGRLPGGSARGAGASEMNRSRPGWD